MKSHKRRGSTMAIIAGVVIVGGIAGAIWMIANNSSGAVTTRADMFTVRTGDFDITVPANGDLDAIQKTEIRNMLDTRATITFIVDEGVTVKKGDVLFRVNDEELRKKIVDTQDAVDQANNRVETATANLEIAKKSRESQLAEADLRIRLAERDFEAWREGVDVARMSELKSNVETQRLETDRLVQRYENSVKLAAEGFISSDELQQDKINMVKAREALYRNQLEKDKYEKYDRKQEEEKKHSEVEQAKAERVRIEQRVNADVNSKESDLSTARRQLERQTEELEKYEAQLGYTEVIAPNDGLVVYQSSLNRDRRNQQDPPEIGTELPPNRTVIVLPDTSRMIAKVKVNEAISGQMHKGLAATVVCDAFSDITFNGTINDVGVLAQGGGWRDPNRREYPVEILINNDARVDLKPGMRCSTNILVGQVSNAVHVPISAVFQGGGYAFTYVPDGRGYSQRQVKLGRSSELYVEILEGLEVGENVLLREPAPEEIVKTLKIGDQNSNAGGAWTGERGAGEGSSAEGSNEAPAESGDASAPQRGEGAGDARRGGREGSDRAGRGGGGMGNMSEEQREQMRKRMEDTIKKYDTDGDGELSDEERAEMMKEFQNRGGGGGQSP